MNVKEILTWRDTGSGTTVGEGTLLACILWVSCATVDKVVAAGRVVVTVATTGSVLPDTSVNVFERSSNINCWYSKYTS